MRDTPLFFITFSFSGENLYFCDKLNNSIYLSDLDGYGVHNLIEIVRPNIVPWDLAFYENRIYWTDWALPALVEAERFQGLYASLAGPSLFRRACGVYIDPGKTVEGVRDLVVSI